MKSGVIEPTRLNTTYTIDWVPLNNQYRLVISSADNFARTRESVWSASLTTILLHIARFARKARPE